MLKYLAYLFTTFWLGVFISMCFGYQPADWLVVIAALQSALFFAFLSIEEAK